MSDAVQKLTPCKTTQAAQLVQALRRHPHTYGDLLALRISTSPWRRA